jgi:hypothetical protein
MILEILSSSISGLIARVACHPLDTLKSRLQSGKYDNRSIFETIFKTYKVEGIKGFYGGLGAVLVGGVPGVCIYLTSYEMTKKKLSEHNSPLKNSTFAIYFSSGMIAEAICCLLFVPVDVVKERLQVQLHDKNISQQNMKYNGSADAFKKILKHEGIRGIYKGYGATMMSYGPFSALYFLFYEELKKYSIESKKSKDITFLESLVYSAGAGALASYITNPLDLVKLRMQLERGSLNTKNLQKNERIYNNMWQSMKVVIKNEGFSGLYRGALARVIFHCPNTAITMALFETINSKYK